VINKARLIPVVAILSALGSLLAFGLKDINTPANNLYSTAEIALEQQWIKGAAPILAANFDSVEITHLNKDVENSFVFDEALSEIYQIQTDYSLPPRDLRALALTDKLEPFRKERSEVFCNIEDQKYCKLILVWDDQAPKDALFISIRIEDSLFALVESNLLAQFELAND
jgi:hypothetical protein